MGTILIIFASIFVLGPIAKAYADRISRQLPPEADTMRAEISQLREEVERLSGQVSQLQDEQGFLVRLLETTDRRQLSEGPGDVE